MAKQLVGEAEIWSLVPAIAADRQISRNGKFGSGVQLCLRSSIQLVDAAQLAAGRLKLYAIRSFPQLRETSGREHKTGFSDHS